MGIRTGNPRGRPTGSKNRRTKAVEQATAEAAEQIAEAIPGAFDGDAHALLMTVYKDPARDIALRLEAAKAAIRYEKPALSALDARVDANMTVNDVSSEPEASEAEWTARHAR